ncbi:MAG: prepilin-type N-terminal cleavage/methylation domain-containing protein [Bacilli bacterium]|nr:prepilin-type N-terminal cleavage/methylation domain-containing protein [Bacilli bacterium]
MKNKKGFTLVELLAVIVILVIIIIIAVTIVKNHTLEAKKKSILANSIAYVKAANTLIVELKTTDNSIIEGTLTVDELNNLGIPINGTKPETGSVVVANSTVVYSCLTYEEYKVEYRDGNYLDVVEGECINPKMNISYTGREKTFKAPVSGIYKLEVWGAQGGGNTPGSTSANRAGSGGYSTGYITLQAHDTLYINVGGAGSAGDHVAGGYNGGGASGNPGSNGSGSGGGATHIALASGLLSSLSDHQEQVLIVAGGGGGTDDIGNGYYNGSDDGSGGDGGGYIGNYAYINGSKYTSVLPGSQTGGFQFGKGQNVTTNHDTGGGGGGFYGGYTTANNSGGGTGGSGYINTTLLEDAEMYCYKCSESNETATKTTSTDCIEETPTENCAKLGNGYAKIFLVSTN